MTRALGSWLSALRRRPRDIDVAPPRRGWEPLPDDVAEWMGAKPYVAARTESRAPGPRVRV